METQMKNETATSCPAEGDVGIRFRGMGITLADVVLRANSRQEISNPSWMKCSLSTMLV